MALIVRKISINPLIKYQNKKTKNNLLNHYYQSILLFKIPSTKLLVSLKILFFPNNIPIDQMRYWIIQQVDMNSPLKRFNKCFKKPVASLINLKTKIPTVHLWYTPIRSIKVKEILKISLPRLSSWLNAETIYWVQAKGIAW